MLESQSHPQHQCQRTGGLDASLAPLVQVSENSSRLTNRADSEVADTHVTDRWVAHLRLWDQLRWVVAVNSTLLSDNP